MTVTVIIPVLDEALTIEAALQRVSRLEGDCEVIVVDGGSADGTISMVTRHVSASPQFARVLCGPKGRARQMNLGASAANGDALLFLHADTSLPEGALRAIEDALADSHVVGGRFRVRLDQRGWRYQMIASSINARDRLFRGFTGDQAIFVRTGVFRELGGYGDMPLMEDLDLGKRMCRAGKVVQLPLCVVTSARRWQKNGVFRTILLMWTLRLLYVLRCPPSWLKRLYQEAR